MIRLLFGAPVSPYFLPGAKQLARIGSAFPKETALDEGMAFVDKCEVRGDYLEFGVWQGRTFAAACFLARAHGLDMQFWAFDSFQGLPKGEGEFARGTYRCDEPSFLRNVKKCVGDLTRVHAVPGWFKDSLSNGNPLLKGIGPVAIAWVDCDLYESTVPVLNFLTGKLQNGSLIFFDDWFCFKGRPDCGEQKACQEWLDRNSQIRLMPYSRFGWNGQSFIVHLAGS